jgi:hypothetical protein
MAISRKPLDVDNYSALDGGNGTEIPGSYRRTNINDIINNFMVSYIGDGKVLSKVPRYEVAFWAQKAVQEFSYDIFYSEKAIEIQLSTTLQMSLPSDYVNYVSFSYTDKYGNMRPILPSQTTKANKGVAQDENYHYLYDQTGDIIFAETSDTIERYQKAISLLTVDELSSYYIGYYNSIYGPENIGGMWGQRYGLIPETSNMNGTYVLDLTAGQVYFSSGFQADDLITLRYISDGLGENGDFSNVFVPKLAEDAVMSSMLYNLVKLRPSGAPMAALYKKEAFSKMRNAKIRLSNMKLPEISQVFRGKSKWIKH